MSVSYTPDSLAKIIHANVIGYYEEDVTLSFLLTDSRRLSFARSSVFFALTTRKNDGHKYISDLAQKGVRCFVVNNVSDHKHLLNKVCFLQVGDTLLALQKLAAYHRQQFSYPVLAITGSNGKTIVKEWLAQLIASDINVVKSPRSFNSQLGVPLSVWQMDERHQLGVFEAGISQPGEMEKLNQIIQPQHGVFTNIGPAHDEGFPDRKNKINEKLRLFKGANILVYNADDSFLCDEIRAWLAENPSVKGFCWGHTPECDLQCSLDYPGIAGPSLQIQYRADVHRMIIPFNDPASFENLMHCLAYLFATNSYHEGIPERISTLSQLAMRLEMKQAINNCILIDDAYSNDILSLSIALDFLDARGNTRNKLVILSDILQSGLPDRELYGQVAILLKEKGVGKMIGIGKRISACKDLFVSHDPLFFTDTSTFLDSFDFSQCSDMGILLKGAREFGFERISNKLQLRDHQTLLEIDLDALVHNLNVFRNMVNPGTRVMAMVKAFSYGSGSYEIAGILQYHRVDYLAVAFADEGNELRRNGITLPIVVLNPELHNLDILFRFYLEPEIYSLGLLLRTIREANNFPQFTPDNPFPVHIKLDTGMHRLGFMENELNQLIQSLLSCRALKVVSVFSHFAGSDQDHLDDFSRRQIRTFQRMCDKLSEGLGYSFLRHICNSSAISRFPEAHLDMVRIGIGLYGVDGSGMLGSQLQNVTTFKSVVSQIKSLKAGESVGYDRAAMLQKDTRIAMVPVGYADGLNRKLGNRNGYMIVNQQPAPIIGNISMDMCALDVTEIEVKEGDETIIFGKELPVAKLARILQTIPYEVFTSIPPRVKRVYFSH